METDNRISPTQPEGACSAVPEYVKLSETGRRLLTAYLSHQQIINRAWTASAVSGPQLRMQLALLQSKRMMWLRWLRRNMPKTGGA